MAGLAMPIEAQASWLTRSLTAAEPNNTVDVNVGATWDLSSKTAKVTREWIREGQAVDVRDLIYEEEVQRLLLQLRVGIFHDIELRIQAPLILNENKAIRFADDVSNINSTLCCAGTSQLADDSSYPYNPRFPITSVPAERYRAGWGDMIFGIGWSPFVDSKDEAFPTLTFRADITAPTGTQRNPADVNALSKTNPASVGMGLTVFDLSMSVSKRMRQETPSFDPYFVLGAELPVASEKQRDLDIKPPIRGRFLVGTEFILYEEEESKQRYALDFGFQTTYVSTGRTYSELSEFLPNFDRTKVTRDRAPVKASDYVYDDFLNPNHYRNAAPGQSCGAVLNVLCGELNQVDQYLNLKGQAAVHLQFTEYSLIRAGVQIEHDTGHFLTNEHTGTDQDPANAPSTCDGGNEQCSGVLNINNSQGIDERSTHWDPRYDVPGRRIRIEQVVDWTFFVTGAATF